MEQLKRCHCCPPSGWLKDLRYMRTKFKHQIRIQILIGILKYHKSYRNNQDVIALLQREDWAIRPIKQCLHRPTIALNWSYLTTELKSQWPCMSPQRCNTMALWAKVIVYWCTEEHCTMMGLLRRKKKSECLNWTGRNISHRASDYLSSSLETSRRSFIYDARALLWTETVRTVLPRKMSEHVVQQTTKSSMCLCSSEEALLQL